MGCNCSEVGLDEVFNARFARRDARRYRKKGLPARARELVRLIEQNLPIKGHSTLEGGAGAGALTVELARRGAESALALDAIPYITQFGPALARDFGVSERAHFVTADFANLPADTPAADIVILDRVVCCYPDVDALLGAATDKATRIVGLVYPRDIWWNRVVGRLMNAWSWLTRDATRWYLYRTDRVDGIMRRAGFAGREVTRDWIWQVVLYRRGSAV